MALKGKLNKPVEITGMADGMRAGSIPDQTLERITKCITAISGIKRKRINYPHARDGSIPYSGKSGEAGNE